MTGKEFYLGDGLYASLTKYQGGGFDLTLRAPRENGDHFVVLETDGWELLVQFLAGQGITANR